METQTILILVAALMILVWAAKLSSRLGVATPILLLVIGVGLSLIPGTPDLVLDPEWILAGVLPPILYAAAVNIPLVDFRRNLPAIGWLSVLLVLASALLTGLLFTWLIPGLPYAAGVALGAIISPPDAVAASALGRRLGLPARLMTMMEGEGLVNDATALVLMRTAIAATAGGFALGGAVLDFTWAVVGAILVGILVGFWSVKLRSKIEDPVIATTFSFAVPFLSFLPAEHFGASGVLAVVVTGLITGHQGAKRFSARIRSIDRINWKTLQSILENGVFLVMGYELVGLVRDVLDQRDEAWSTVGIAALACIALLIIRTVFVIPLILWMRSLQGRARVVQEHVDRLIDTVPEAEDIRGERFQRALGRRRADLVALQNEGLGWRGGAVLAWAGMRGVVTLAAAQALPESMPYRSEMVLIALMIAVATLLINGISLPGVIRLLKLGGVKGHREQVDQLVEELSETGRRAIVDADLTREDGTPYPPELVERVERDLKARAKRHHWRYASHEDDDVRDYRQLKALALEAEREALLELRSTGEYSSRAIAEGENYLDVEEIAQEGPQSEH